MMLRQFGLTGVNLDDVSSWTLDRDRVENMGSGRFVANQDSLVMISDHDSKRKYPNHAEVSVSSVSPVLTISFRSSPTKTLTYRGPMASLVFASLNRGDAGGPIGMSEEELREASLEEIRSFRAIRIEFRTHGNPPDLSLRTMLERVWASYTADDPKGLQCPTPPATVVFRDPAGRELDPDISVSQAPSFTVTGR